MSRGAIDVGSNIHETNDDIIRKHGVVKFLTLRPPAVLRTRLPPILVRHTKTRIAPRRSGFSFSPCSEEMKVGPAKRKQSASPFPLWQLDAAIAGPAVVSFSEWGRKRVKLRKREKRVRR